MAVGALLDCRPEEEEDELGRGAADLEVVADCEVVGIGVVLEADEGLVKRAFAVVMDEPPPTPPPEHKKLPIVFVQLTLQEWDPSTHSSPSMHDTPSPLNPVSHEHVKLPAVLLHVAFEWQLSAA
eukprot:3856514-Rhodomonas_salina.1